MPELPEVEVLVRHLAPLLKNKTIRVVRVLRAKVVEPTTPRQLQHSVSAAKFCSLIRRGKYLVFTLRKRGKNFALLGHLGMTGRFYLQPARNGLPKHTAVVLELGRENLIYEDTRYFGRLTLDTGALARLGPEPLAPEFTAKYFATALKTSRQPIKVKLLDQSLVAGVGNIYASETLFRAKISPRLAAKTLSALQIKNLRRAIREVLREAIDCGSTIPLNFSGETGDGLFYFGKAADSLDYYEERLRVYDREGKPCVRCGAKIKCIIQAARSTFYCPRCQRG
jgi:formamidopyrimidine-DNA glycosylase